MKTPRGGKFWGAEIPAASNGFRGSDKASEVDRQLNSERSNLALPNLKSPPRIPAFGQAAHLSPRVLLSGVISNEGSPRKDARSKGSGLNLPRLRLGAGSALPSIEDVAGGSGPESSREGMRKEVLAMSISNASGTGFSRKSKSCGPRLQRHLPKSPRDLQSTLFRGDHTHRLRDYPPDDKDARTRCCTPPPDDGPRFRGPYEFRTSKTSGAGSVIFEIKEAPAPDRSGLGSPPPVSVMDEPLRRQVSGATSEAKSITDVGMSFTVSVTDLTSPTGRDASIRASFRLEEAVIEAAILELHRYDNSSQWIHKNEERVPQVTALVNMFESSGLSKAKQPQGYLDRDSLEDHHEDGQPSITSSTDESQADVAASMEISSCAAILNFYRWLCGLPLVRLNLARLTICNMVSVALLPRATPSQKLGPESSAFEEALADIITHHGSRIAVLHGESSLLSAVEQSLSSTHALSSRGLEVLHDRRAHASSIASRVEASNPDALVPPAQARFQKERLARKAWGATARKCDYDHPSTPLCKDLLPAPLTPLSMLWDLQPEHPVAVEDNKISGKHSDSKGRSQRRDPRMSMQSCVRAPLPIDNELSTIWADRDGALAFRRCLLSPGLREFGAARRQDTCVLWTSSDTSLESAQGQGKRRSSRQDQANRTRSSRQDVFGEPLSPTSPTSRNCRLGHRGSKKSAPSKQGSLNSGSQKVPEAVCWPPSGIVPMSLVADRRAAWTIMPDGKRFQPTESTQIRVWKVRFDRPAYGAWSAERLVEVPVRGFAIDCSSIGEPFCTIFWPDFGPSVEGCQLEVELNGLRGDRTQMNFFYEFKDFLQKVLDEHLCAEAASFRHFIGETAFWGPRILAERSVIMETEEHTPPRPIVKKSHTLSPYHFEKPPQIYQVSYQENSYNTSAVDVTIVLQSDEVSAILGELHLVRFSGEEEEVPYGAIVQKLPSGNYFLVRAKLPMCRQRFELRLYYTMAAHPDELKRHPLRYFITTNKECQSFLTGLDDPRKKKFGFCQLDPLAQTHGVVVIAPTTRSIGTGSCYFLVYVDKEVALASARAELAAAFPDVIQSIDAGDGSPARCIQRRSSKLPPPKIDGKGTRRNMRLYTDRLQIPAMADEALCRAAKKARSFVQTSADNQEELDDTPPPTRGQLKRLAIGALESPSPRGSKAPAGRPTTVANVQHSLRAILEKNTQDVSKDVALDVALHGGQVFYSLKERHDFPGLYEGLFYFGESHDDQTVELYFRFPVVHSVEFAPRRLGEWFVSRDELQGSCADR